MEKSRLYFITWSLLSMMAFFASCNGQVKTDSPKDAFESHYNETKRSAGNPKVIKTQGTNQYDNIHCGLADKSGNLWFGTTGEGVYRYDGKLFFQFTEKDGLSSNTVWSILEDKTGKIWIGTDSGLCVYDGNTFKRISFFETNGFPSINPEKQFSYTAKNDVWSIMQDKAGKIWFGTRDGIYCFDGISYSRFPTNNVVNKDSLSLKMVDCIIEDKDGNIWFGSGMPPGMEGLCRYDGKSLTRFNPGGEKWIRYILEDKSGTIWLGTRHQGIWKYDGKSFTKFISGNDIGLSALVDTKGNIWFSGGEKSDGYSSDGGLSRYNSKFLETMASKDGAIKYGVWCMVEDHDGNIWLGTRNNGLYRYDGKTFTSFSE